MQTRREFLAMGGVLLTGLAFPSSMKSYRADAKAYRGLQKIGDLGIVDILMMSDRTGAEVWFDPIGVFIEPGQTVRWTIVDNVHTTTAYHPQNGNHSLRIPQDAVPWDSGYLVNPGDSFEVSFAAEGVYDYFCTPHEAAGMVGRIIVGRPTGPGAQPFDYYKGRPDTAEWQPLPEAAQKALPDIDRIMREKIVRHL
jgi:plastocyanin